MTGLPSWLENSGTWQRMKKLAEERRFPSCCAICAPLSLHGSLAVETARLLLCESGDGRDGCGSCAAWTEGGHPDMILCGSEGVPPTVEMCRDLAESLAYRPVISRRRVGVVFSGDKLLLHAANSLLKLSEEPPEFASILFLISDEDVFLPTLKSRSWILSFPGSPEREAADKPLTQEEWIGWIQANGTADPDELLGTLASWVEGECRRGDFAGAARVESVRLLLGKKRLSRVMALDLIVLALKEGIAIEHVFGDIW